MKNLMKLYYRDGYLEVAHPRFPMAVAKIGKNGKVDLSLVNEKVKDDIIDFLKSKIQSKSDLDKLIEKAKKEKVKRDIKAAATAAADKAKEKAKALDIFNQPPPPRTNGMTDKEYYDSDAYYNWKHRIDSIPDTLYNQIIDTHGDPNGCATSTGETLRDDLEKGLYSPSAARADDPAHPIENPLDEETKP